MVGLFAGPLLHLAVHVPPGCRFPSGAEQSLLRDAGVSAIIADADAHAAAHAHADARLPVVCGGATDGELHADGARWLWLRGSRASLLERATALQQIRFVASLPSGGASSESALHRSCTLAWQLHSTHRCSAIVLVWPELEAAAAAAGSDGWASVAKQLARMQRPAWTLIQGG
jgi:hypothetical protein